MGREEPASLLSLSAEAVAEIDRFRTQPPVVEDPSILGRMDEPEWCLIIGKDGEYPLLRTFQDADELAKFINHLDGQDVAVFPFYGVPLQFTKRPHRVLFLPNGDVKPIFDVSAVGRMEIRLDQERTRIEETGFLGPEALAVAVPDDVVEFDPDDWKALEEADVAAAQAVDDAAEVEAAEDVEETSAE